MPAASATLTVNLYPNGHVLYQNKMGLLGTGTISAGTYTSGGVPVTSVPNNVYETNTVIWGTIYSPTSGYRYAFNTSTGAIRIFGSGSAPPAVTAAAFAIQASGFGATGSIASVSGNQSAFSLTVTGAGGTYGTNPTIVYTFPQAYTVPPVVVVCRGNDAAVQTNAGYWVAVDGSMSTTSCTLMFVGTPTAASYVCDAIVVDVGTNPSAPVVAGSFAASSGWGAAPVLALGNSSSTQNAFSLSVTCNTVAAANPTITLTFPAAYSTAPIFVTSDGILKPDVGKWAFVSSTLTTATFQWVGTPVNGHVYILDAVCVNPTVPAVTAAMFTPSSGWGTSPTVAVTGTQSAFQLSITAKATTAANPTVSLAVPSTLVQVPVYVASRGDAVAVTTGFFAPVDASNTTAAAVFKYVGTPTANNTYVLDVVSQLPPGSYNELAVGGTIPPQVVADTLLWEVIENLSS